MFMNNSELRKISMNELPSWSPWPARLLSLDSFKIRHKTTEAVIREFGDDKWGALLKIFSDKKSFTLADVEAMEQDLDELIPCFERDFGFYLALAKEASVQQIDLYRDTNPTFYSSSREFVKIAIDYGAVGEWDGHDQDTPITLTDDIFRNSFSVSNNELWTYYAGESGGIWQEGMIIKTDIAAALEIFLSE